MNFDISDENNKNNNNNFNNKYINNIFENNNPVLIDEHFNIGIDSKEKEKNEIISKSKLCLGFIDNNLVRVMDNLLFFNGFEYRKIKKYYKSKKENNIIHFRCKNYRKYEGDRNKFGKIL